MIILLYIMVDLYGPAGKRKYMLKLYANVLAALKNTAKNYLMQQIYFWFVIDEFPA